MIDLTNKTVEEVNALIQKYASVLELIKPQYQPFLAVIIDIGVQYVKTNHNDLPLDWKTWSIVVLKNKYFKGKVHKETDIPNIIAEFIQCYKDNYAEYIQQLGMSASEFDRDYGFVCRYMQ
jgi:hypothetical protein